MAWEKGQTLQYDKYSIIEVIGKGGFGLTYLARDNFRKQDVVIKRPVQLDGEDMDKYYQRLKREGEVLVPLNHPNIVKVIDRFWEDGIPCLVIEYVKGKTLYQYIDSKKYLSQDKALECFRKLAEALQVVYQEKIYHCDIHPGNIMIRDSSEEPVLIDFGSAKLLQPHSVSVSTTINTSFSPYEQMLGGEPLPTWDVYALAASMYFAVTGKKPLPAAHRMSKNNDFIPPQKERRELSDWVNQAILKGMALEPEDRSQSMEAWLDLLQPPKVVIEEPSQPPKPAPPPSLDYS